MTVNFYNNIQRIIDFDYDVCSNNLSVGKMCEKYGLDSKANWKEVAERIMNEINATDSLTHDPVLYRIAEKHILCLRSLLRVPQQFIRTEEDKSNWKSYLKMAVAADAFILTAMSGLGLCAWITKPECNLNEILMITGALSFFPTISCLLCAFGSYVSSRISSYYLNEEEPKIKSGLAKKIDVIEAVPEPLAGSSSIERLSYYMNAERNRTNVTVEDVSLDNLHEIAQLSSEYDLGKLHFKEFAGKPITNQIKLEKLNNRLDPWFFEEPRELFEQSKLNRINCA